MEEIKAGSRVVVTFSSGSVLYGCVVRSMPRATGDSWTLEDKYGKEIRVQMFETIALSAPEQF